MAQRIRRDRRYQVVEEGTNVNSRIHPVGTVLTVSEVKKMTLDTLKHHVREGNLIPYSDPK